ncbi:hypothetical protein BH10BAC3_BH10BAC3_00920 [soil metagenome]
MKILRYYSMIAAISAVITACNTTPKSNSESDALKGGPALDGQQAKTFVDSVNKMFTEEVKNGDSVALAAHYSTDAELLFEHSEPIKGKDILTAWGGVVRAGVKGFTFQTTDITVSGDLLVETGADEMKMADKTLIDRGKYVVVWKKEDGAWKLFRDMGNTSMPAAK